MATFPSSTSAYGRWGPNDILEAQMGSNWPAVTDPYFKNVSLLLSGDGVDGSADSIITDSSNNNFAITIAGDTKSTGFNPYLTGWSNYFDGAGDYLGITTNTAFSYGTGDFTFEAWIYPTVNTAQAIIGHGDGASANPYFYLNGLTPTLYFNNTAVATSANVTLNTWNHIAVTRSGTNVLVFTNGVSGTPATNSTSLSNTVFLIGTSSASTQFFTGHISNLRIVKGTALYTTNFTPNTTPLTAVAGTSLLTCTSNRFQDLSTNNHTIIRYGDTKVTSFNPYNLTNTSKYGSAYFDGTGDYLTVPASTNLDLTGDFTIEFWVNAQATSYIVCNGTQGGSGCWAFYFNAATGVLNYEMAITTWAGVVMTTPNSTMTTNTWTHIAVTRSSTSFRLFVNGVVAATTTNAGSLINTGRVLQIGYYVQSSGTSYLTGYLSNLRIVKGTALYTSNFIPSSTPLTAVTNTSLLTCQYKTAPTNDMVLDSSANNLVVTTTGNATQGSFSPYADRWSNYFDGTGDYLSVPDNTAAVQLVSGNFTVEGWIFCITTANPGRVINNWSSSTTAAASWEILTVSGGSLIFNCTTNGTTNVVSLTGTIVSNTWNHFAAVRSDNLFILYINGIQVATTTQNITLQTANTFTIGSRRLGASYVEGFGGYLSNIRIVKGTALYTANFTPSTTPLTAIAGTSLLTCASNRFQDLSINNHTITPAGDIKVQRLSPFSPSSTYVSSILGGSTYFDGTSDYLETTAPPNLQLTTGNFTVEAWIYPLSFSGPQYSCPIFAYGDDSLLLRCMPLAATSTNLNMYAVNAAGSVILGTSGTSGGNVYLNQWTHVAVTRSGSTFTLWVNGASVATATSADTLKTNSIVWIGRSSAGSNPWWSGYISNLRVVKGTAVYTANFTPPNSPVTAISGTSLLIDSTNGAIVDHTGISDFETVGDVKVSTVQSKWGSSSIYFDGIGDYLSFPYNIVHALEATDFTIEAWIYRAQGGVEHNIAITRPASLNSGWNLRINPTNLLQFYYTGGSTVSSTGTIPVTTWTHVAVTRSGTLVRLFINGILDTTATFANGTANTEGLRIGIDNTNAAGAMNGYIDDLRITKGIARYTSNTFDLPPISPKL